MFLVISLNWWAHFVYLVLPFHFKKRGLGFISPFPEAPVRMLRPISSVYSFYRWFVLIKIQTQSTHGIWLIGLLNLANWVVEVARKERLVTYQVSYLTLPGPQAGTFIPCEDSHTHFIAG